MIIMIGARKRQGKDTFADMLKNHLLRPSKKMSCIQHARETMVKLFPILSMSKDTDDKDKYRETIISIVDACLKTQELCFAIDLHNRYQLQSDIFIVPDLRRKCEMDFFKGYLKEEAIFILVDNPRLEKVDSYGEGSIDDHELWDYVVENNGTLEDLESKAKVIAREINFGLKDPVSPVYLS